MTDAQPIGDVRSSMARASRAFYTGIALAEGLSFYPPYTYKSDEALNYNKLYRLIVGEGREWLS